MATSKDQKHSKKIKKNFIIVFLATILIIRLLIYFIPQFIPNIKLIFVYGDNFHHIFIGLALLAIYFFIKTYTYAFYLLAVCLGLIVDQLAGAPFYIADIINKPLAPYSFWYSWSPYNLITTTILIIVSIILIQKYKK